MGCEESRPKEELFAQYIYYGYRALIEAWNYAVTYNSEMAITVALH
jgi:hypothetical protein